MFTAGHFNRELFLPNKSMSNLVVQAQINYYAKKAKQSYYPQIGKAMEHQQKTTERKADGYPEPLAYVNRHDVTGKYIL